jgi:hypothetical protein
MLDVISNLSMARECSQESHNSIAFSICTLVSQPEQYAKMIDSFRSRGFGGGDVEFLYIDNSRGNAFDAYSGLRRLITSARGQRIILCHQDVLLIGDGRAELEARLAMLDRNHSDWALAGNAGGTEDRRLVLRISDPHGENQSTGDFPERVVSLDENFIVLKRASGVMPSRDLSGFHLYGTDLCNNARATGHSAWVIDFHVRHLSRGSVGRDYYDVLDQIETKAMWLLQPRRIKTTCMSVILTPSKLKRAWLTLSRLRKKRKRIRHEAERIL